MLLTSFDPDFASPADWAIMYRKCGLQVVPAPYPMRSREDKRPSIGWRQYQNEIAPDADFDRWFPGNCSPNMGVIAGRASDNLLVIDLDDYKSGSAAEWWTSVTSGIERETWTQTTGGGGRQIFFRLPADVTISSHRTAMGVDIRSQGGFAMLPPSRHLSGKEYEWARGLGPWECECEEAPDFIIQAVVQLIEEHGGVATAHERVERTSTPSTDFDAFGGRVDGREEYMTKLVWGAVVDWRRECPIPPTEAESSARMREAYPVYERAVKSRIHEPGMTKSVLLEREGRGATAFAEKWRAAMRQWDGKVAEHAKEVRLTPSPLEQAKAAPAGDDAPPLPAGIFEFLSVSGIKTLPDPQWLVKGLVTESALGFIFGPPGCGKSFIAIGMGLSLAVGMPDWWGRKIERQGAVIYISSEGVSDLKFRIEAWEHTNQVLADDAPFFLIRQSINFMKAEDVDRLVATVEAISEAHNVQPVAVFVDTVSRVLPGADENLQKDMTLFVRACDAVRERFGATVIGVHHTSRGGNLRGSTVFDGAGDFLAQIERGEGEPIGTLTAKKIKAAQDGWKEAFKLETITLGIDRTSLVAIATQDAPKVENPAAWPDKETCRRILAQIDREWGKGTPWSPFPQSRSTGRFAPKLIASEYGVPAAVAAEMVEKWLMNGVLGVEIRDTDTKLKGLKVTGRID